MDVVNVAACILNECGNLSTMKLQKLCFYSQAYHLVRLGVPLFEDDFEAWANGPVVPRLFQRHRGRFVLSRGFFGEGDLNDLGDEAARSIGHVVTCLRDWDGASLSTMTHNERPWLDAREGCAPAERCSRVISKEAIKAFYASSAVFSNPVFAP